jgi:hypothetical protein
MKKLITVMLLSLGFMAFAQPTSGDITMDKIDSATVAPSPLQTQQTFENGLIDAFKTGNAERIAAYFGENVDLSILGKTNLYSSSQAQQILQHFFTDHAPSEFTVIHKGQARASQYFIGELTTANGIYRVTINSKTEGNKKVINSLTIAEN